MSSETLPCPTQPDEPPNVHAGLRPCHEGKAQFSCGFCAGLMDMADLQAQTLHCVSCEAPFGQVHTDICLQVT